VKKIAKLDSSLKQTYMKKLFASLFCLIPMFLSAQQMEQHFKIYDVKKKQQISINEIINDMAKADVLFFGEEHNDSIGHYLKVELLKALHHNYKTALTLEMFHTDIQGVMDEYLAGLISEKNFIKEGRAWNNYKDYKPMVEFAKEKKLPVIAANAATRYTNAVTRSGFDILSKLPNNSKRLLPPLPIDTLTGRYHEKFIDLLGGHSMGGMKVYQSQNLWDATMAWSIANFAKANKDTKIFQVNGRFHSDEKLGTIAQLHKYAPKLKALNIAAFPSEDFNNPIWEKHALLGDYIILTDPTVKKTF
jgi:uncharacterized iron-regulated protein